MSNYDSMLKLKQKLAQKEESSATEDILTVELAGEKFQDKNGETVKVAKTATASKKGTAVKKTTNANTSKTKK